MKILAVDSTGENLVIAVFDGQNVFSKISTEGAKKHNSMILPYIDATLSDAKLSINDIDILACVVGPGSFTGIRIGISTVKALATALNIKCVAVNSLELLAYNIKSDEFYTAIDCRHNSYFCGKYKDSYLYNIEMRVYPAEFLTDKNVKYKTSASMPVDLINIVIDKVNSDKYGELSPIYLRKSQAEREREGD